MKKNQKKIGGRGEGVGQKGQRGKGEELCPEIQRGIIICNKP